MIRGRMVLLNGYMFGLSTKFIIKGREIDLYHKRLIYLLDKVYKHYGEG